MKKVLIFILVVVIVLEAYSQVVYENLYQDKGAYSGTSIKPTTDNGYIITGFCNPTGAFFGQDLLALKIDSLGDVMWAKNFGGVSSDYGREIIQSVDGGYLVVGDISNGSTASRDVFIVKMDENGNELWSKIIGDTLGDRGAGIVENMSDSTIVIAASVNDLNYCLIKLNKLGDTLWTKTYPDTVNIMSLSKTSDGGFVACGIEVGDKGFVSKLDVNGNVDWKKSFFGGENLMKCFEIANGNIAVVGRSLLNSPPPKTDGIMRILDGLDGEELMANTYGGSLTDDFNDGIETPDGNFVFVGVSYFSSQPYDQDQFYIVKTDEDGAVLWERDFGADFPDSEIGFSICNASDGGYIACGQRVTNGEAHLFVIKISESGSTVSIKETIVPTVFSIYPNPATTYFTLDFEESISKNTIIDVLNIEGRSVYKTRLDNGESKVKVNCESFARGVYLVRVNENNKIITNKIIIN